VAGRPRRPGTPGRRRDEHGRDHGREGHIAGLTGPEHVGLGLDYADESEEEYDFYGYDERYYPRPPWVWPEGLEWLHRTRAIAPALAARGFTPAEVDGVLGGNFLRVLADIWGG
jgi:membrane dipeptidase